MHMHIDICLRSRQLKQFELFVKQNSNTFLFDLKQFSKITIVREHKYVFELFDLPKSRLYLLAAHITI